MLYLLLYYLLKPLVILFCKIFFSLKAKGIENLPKKGGVIIAANHSSYLDPVALGTAIPRRIYWVLMKEVYHYRPLHWLFVITSCICMNGAIKKTLEALNREKAVVIFPEGGRSRTGKLQQAKTGIGVVALESGRPVVPVAIVGAFQAYPPQARFPKRHPVEIRVGKPVVFKKEYPDQQASTAEIKEATDNIMNRLSQLLEKD